MAFISLAFLCSWDRPSPRSQNLYAPTPNSEDSAICKLASQLAFESLPTKKKQHFRSRLTGLSSFTKTKGQRQQLNPTSVIKSFKCRSWRGSFGWSENVWDLVLRSYQLEVLPSSYWRSGFSSFTLIFGRYIVVFIPPLAVQWRFSAQGKYYFSCARHVGFTQVAITIKISWYFYSRSTRL